MTTQTTNQPTINDQIESFISIVELTRSLGLKPMAAITVLESDGEYCGALLVLYAAETSAVAGKPQCVAMAPYFFTGEAATVLEQRGILTQVHESRRSGISTVWCEISQSFV